MSCTGVVCRVVVEPPLEAEPNVHPTSESVVGEDGQQFLGSVGVVGVDVHPDVDLELVCGLVHVRQDAVEGRGAADSGPVDVVDVRRPIEGHLRARDSSGRQFLGRLSVPVPAIGDDARRVLLVGAVALGDEAIRELEQLLLAEQRLAAHPRHVEAVNGRERVDQDVDEAVGNLGLQQ